MSLPRVLIQVALVGSQIIARAFVEAYQKAAASILPLLNINYPQDSIANAAESAASKSSNEVSRKTGMNLDEAIQILNIDKSKQPTKDDIIKQYEALFNINDPKTGGSIYLQSKVVRARERLELEILKNEEDISNDSKGESK